MKGGILVRWPELSGIGVKNVTNDLYTQNESRKWKNDNFGDSTHHEGHCCSTSIIMGGKVVTKRPGNNPLWATGLVSQLNLH